MPSRLIKVVPNVLSSLRLGLALLFPFLPVHWRLPAMIAGGLSDWIDGLIARRYQATSAAGGLLDAIADKLFTLSVLVTLVLTHPPAAPHIAIMWWQALIVLSRDLVVGGIAAYALTIRRHDTFWHMRPRLPGKLTTTFVFLWLVAVLSDRAPPVLDWPLFILAGGTSVLAGADYYLQFLHRPAQFRGRREEANAVLTEGTRPRS